MFIAFGLRPVNFDIRTTSDSEIFFPGDDEEVVNGTFEDVDANGIQLAVKPLSSTYKGSGGNNNANFPVNSILNAFDIFLLSSPSSVTYLDSFCKVL